MASDQTLQTPSQILETGREHRAKADRLRTAIAALEKRTQGARSAGIIQLLFLGFMTVLAYSQTDWDEALTHRTALSLMSFLTLWIWAIHSTFSQFKPDPVKLAILDLLEAEQTKSRTSD